MRVSPSLLWRSLRAMESAIPGHQGVIRQSLGHGIMTLFPSSADNMVRALERCNGDSRSPAW